MSRKIKLTDEDIDVLLEQFKKDLTNTRFDSKTVTLTADTELKETQKVKLKFTPEAFCKMRTLITNCEKEIAWHGVVETPEENIYVISDILVYPQEVSGATVTSNDERYPMWLMQLPEETFNKLRFQGHSHVNFGATPSSTDLNLYNNMLQTLQEDDFYIFFIMNKKSDVWAQIYNLKENIVYETKDIDIEISFNNQSSMEWYGAQCRDMIVEPKPAVYVDKTTIPKTSKKQTVEDYKKDDSWRWDYVRKCYVPTDASDLEISGCFKRAKKNAKSKKEYTSLAAAELLELHRELEQEKEMLESYEKDQTGYEYWKKYMEGGYLDD